MLSCAKIGIYSESAYLSAHFSSRTLLFIKNQLHIENFIPDGMAQIDAFLQKVLQSFGYPINLHYLCTRKPSLLLRAPQALIVKWI